MSDMLSIAASVAGIVAALYVAIIGQKNLPEWWRGFRGRDGRTREETNAALAVRPRIVHNLPQRSFRKFVNRVNELSSIIVDLCSPSFDEVSSPVIVVVGPGGAGKTALALRAAYSILEDYSAGGPILIDSIIWCSAKQHELTIVGMSKVSGRARTVMDIYRTVTLALGRADIMRAPPEFHPELVRNLLAAQRTLLIIDNVEVINDDLITAFVQDLPFPTRALITSRINLGIGRELHISGLAAADAKQLAKQELEAKGMIGSKAVTEALYDGTGGVALAIVWSVAQLAYGYELGTVLSRLQRPGGDVVTFSFEGAVDGIRGTLAHKVLMAIGLFSTGASREALGVVAGTDDVELRDSAIAELVRLSLIEIESDRVWVLPLTRQLIASELVMSGEFNRAARQRVVEYYDGFVKRNVGTEYWQPITLWLSGPAVDNEIENVLQCFRWAGEDNDDERLISIGGPLVHYLWRVGRVEERREISERCASAAAALGETEWQVWMLVDGLGYIYLARQDMTEATRVLDEGIRTAVDVGFSDGEALGLAYMVHASALRGHFAMAVERLERANQLTGRPEVLARVKAVEGHLALFQRDWRSAEAHYRNVIELRRVCDGYDPPTQMALLGLVTAQQGRRDEAVVALNAAMQHMRQTKEGLGYAHFGMAVLAGADSRFTDAQEQARIARANLEGVGISVIAQQLDSFIDELRSRTEGR